jgi:hypothetical protein
VLKPANVSFEEAAAVPIAATTALQALRDHGRVQPGQKVLINGASGGVGTFAVQIAKSFGAEVTAVCSTRNVAVIRSLGADHVVDYTQEDFTQRSGDRHDLMLDIAGSRSFKEFRRTLTPEATVVVVGARMSNQGLGPLSHVIGTRLASLGRSQTVKFFIAKITKEDLVVLHELLEAGKVRSVIDRRYGLAETADALRYLGEGHTPAERSSSPCEAVTASQPPSKARMQRRRVERSESSGAATAPWVAPVAPSPRSIDDSPLSVESEARRRRPVRRPHLCQRGGVCSSARGTARASAFPHSATRRSFRGVMNSLPVCATAYSG